MIKLKTKIVGKDEESMFIQCQKYRTKNTNTLEHVCAIDILVCAIMDNDEDMTITKLCKLIKENYNEHVLEKEVE